MKFVRIAFTFTLLTFLASSLYSANKIRIAVNYFDVVTGVDPNLKTTLAVLLESKLSTTGRFTVVDRANLDKVLKEQSIQLGGCSDSACAVKVGNILNVQRMAVGNLSKISKRYKVVIKFLDVELGSLDEVVGTVEEWANGEEELEKAIDRVAQTISERVPLTGQVIQIDSDGIYVNLGRADKIEEGQEVEVKRTSERIIDQSTGQVLGVKASLAAKGTLTDIQPQLSRIVLKEDKGVKPNVRVKDDVIVVITEKFKKEQGEKNFKLAKAYLQNKNYDEAKSAVDKALSYQKNNRDYLSLKDNIEKQIDEVNLKQADAKEKERLRQEQIAAQQNRSRSSGRTSFRPSSSRSGFSVYGGLTHFRPLADTEFGAYFSAINGVAAGAEIAEKNWGINLVGKHYFFLNQVDPLKVSLPYKTMQAIMSDLHMIYRFKLPIGIFVPHAGAGLFYRHLNFRIDDESIQGGFVESKHWGLGWEVQAGLMLDFGPFGIDLKASYEGAAIISLGSSGSDGYYKSGTAEPTDKEKEKRLSMSGIQIGVDAVIKF